MKKFESGIKETFTVTTLVAVVVAVLGYMAARLLHQNFLGRFPATARLPELSDLIVMVLGAGFLSGVNGTAVVIGSGISLVNNLGARWRVPWLRVG